MAEALHMWPVEHIHHFFVGLPCLPEDFLDSREGGTHNHHRFSKTPGSTTQTTTKLVTINAAATAVTKNTLPLLAGNFPRMIQYWLSK